MIKILYLEDDINLSETIEEFLEENDFDVDVSYNGKEALNKLYKSNFDVLIFDVNLPDINGFELVQNLRDSDIYTPVIFTTTLNDIDSLDKGYEVGADDYLRKPFALKELLHRINTLVKRSFKTKDTKVQLDTDIFFDISSNTLLKDSSAIKLNQKETQLLKLFIKYKNKIITLENIYLNVWNTSETHSEASLRTYIKNIRKMIGKEKIISIKKQGYKLVV